MKYRPENPLITQSDRTILLEVDNPRTLEVRDLLVKFAELEKSPEHIHTYRISPLSVWNAASLGMKPGEIVAVLEQYGKYSLPPSLRADIEEYASKYGLLRLEKGEGTLILFSRDPSVLQRILRTMHLKKFFAGPPSRDSIPIHPHLRGSIKQALIRMGYPVDDLAGYERGNPLSMKLLSETGENLPFSVRDYQREAADVFYSGGSAKGGSGVIVLPCGAGKTIVGMAVMEHLQTETLILSTSNTAVYQWRRELLDKTDLKEEQIGIYTGERKDIRPVTISTYQILTYRRSRTDSFLHFYLFSQNNWGLIIYDEVHLLPAPVFRVTAEIQAKRRLGLTATLIREDRREEEVFTLIGPKRYDMPWKVLEGQGWIATAFCVEVRISFPEREREAYETAPRRALYRIASENKAKISVVKAILKRHKADRILIIGQYLRQLRTLQRVLKAPIITGKTPEGERKVLYRRFRTGNIPILIVSRVGNFAIDLPDANVAVQVSGTFGSRQEEAQRLGRILRPKKEENRAVFYTLITKDTRDQEFAAKRQLFLTEQGYTYRIVDEREILNSHAERLF